LLPIVAIGAIALGGCASHSTTYHEQTYAGAGAGAHGMVRPTRVEIEEDGLPVQTPPPPRRRVEADDPSEPFSPNYGGPRQQPAAAPSPQRPLAASVRGPVEPAATVAPPSSRPSRARMSQAEADLIIATAIAAHERRRP
jgi:hypothetical protein